MYVPHVLGVVAGQTIEVTNSDKTTHNVHTYAGDETTLNQGQPPGSPGVAILAEGEPGQAMTFACDVHKWMEAHVVVSDHPFFAVTGDDGAFTIKDVPAGRYTVEAWHEELGRSTQKVTLAPHGDEVVGLAFAAP
jgi:hypothetical protein